MLMVAAGGVLAQPAPTGPILRVQAGDGQGPVAVNEFLPDRFRIVEGTTVTWTIGSDEPHTVTFLGGRTPPSLIVPQPEDPAGRAPMLNPEVFFPVPPTGPYTGTGYVNAGFLEKGEQFSLTFGASGTYPFLCLVHPQMRGEIEVVPVGSTNITSQAAVDQYVATHTATVHAAEIAEMNQTRSNPVRQVDAQGRAVWYVRAGTRSPDAHVELNLFFPDVNTISQGDTIVWYNDSPTTPHTITFPAANVDPPEFLVPTLPDGTPLTGPPPAGPPPAGPPDPSMTPRLVLGPGSFPTHPGQLPSYDGTGLYNSGLIGDPAPPQAGSAWSMVFNTPGTFKFICVVHPGMEGTVVVQPR